MCFLTTKLRFMHFGRELWQGIVLFSKTCPHICDMCVFVASFFLPSFLSISRRVFCVIKSSNISVGSSIYPKYLIFCTTGTHTHYFFFYIVQWSFSNVVQFCSALQQCLITAARFNEAFNIQKGCVWMGRSCHILCCFPIPFGVLLPLSPFFLILSVSIFNNGICVCVCMRLYLHLLLSCSFSLCIFSIC